MSASWLKPIRSGRQIVELRDRTSAPVRGSVENYARERLVRTAHGDLYEREEYRCIRLWRGRSGRDVHDV